MAKDGKSLIVLLLFFFFGCKEAIKTQIEIPKIERAETSIIARAQEPIEKRPEFLIENEPISPLNLKKISINVRSIPLRDILFIVSKDAGINLVMEKDVDPTVPVTAVLKDVSIEDALQAILSSTDYSFKIERNVLRIRSKETRIFHLGTIPIYQTYSTEVGGDILGGVTGQIVSGSTSGGTTQLKGNVSKSEKVDDAAYKFWETVEKTLQVILSKDETFVVNRLTGTIMVEATKRNLQKVKEYLETIKKAVTKQVLIEAKIIEVTLSDSLKYGIDWSFLRQWSTDSHNFTIGGGTTGFTSVIPEGSPFSDLRFSFTSTYIKDFSFIIKALSQFGNIKTLSNPRISILNGQTSLFTVGRNFSFVSKAESNVTTSAAGTPIITYTVETSNLLSGLILGIVPYIDDKGEILLTITPIVSNLLNVETRNFGTTGNQTIIQLPVVDLRELSTVVKVKDGEIVVIGGLIKREERVVEGKTPIVGNIPVLGNLFKSKEKEEVNTELVILLQPRIL